MKTLRSLESWTLVALTLALGVVGFVAIRASESALDERRAEDEAVASAMLAQDARIRAIREDLTRTREGISEALAHIRGDIALERSERASDGLRAARVAEGQGRRIEALQAALEGLEAQTAALAASCATANDLEALSLVLNDWMAARTAPSADFVVPVRGTWVVRRTFTSTSGDSLLDTTDESPDADIGTGFVMGTAHGPRMVTARHLFDEQTMEGSGIYAGQFGLMKIRAVLQDPYFLWNGMKFPLTVPPLNAERDATVCKFDPKGYGGPLGEWADGMPEYGAPVWVVTNRPGVRAGSLPVRGVYAGAKGTGEPDSFYTHIAALAAAPGYSGSPVLYRGKVIGITIHGYPGSVMGLTPLADILPLLVP